ncbi:hypothetical protein F5878DRAFT_670999 [Lentinula raphanica]|uniref:Uncharacterized protein n=1 Tax=Lentinula raphanica TaxID=153919 RepID=A0AA38NWV7_9AGAR|nr:hypothetical protein F5878DRAFT_670999 [Lentinula raphanica]
MHLVPSLPNELLHSIVEYTAYAYTYTYCELDSHSHSLHKYASPELLALSVANWQLRRLCLPFLFAKLVIWFGKGVQQLKDETLVVENITESEDLALSQIIPQFEKLSDVDMQLHGQAWDGINSLRAILAHPNVTSVLVNELPDESMCNVDLSKVVFNSTTLSILSPEFDNYLNCGMRIKILCLSKDESLGSEFGSKILSGLKEIWIFDYKTPDSLSWLPVLSSTHPTLNELWLLEKAYNDDIVTLPFFPSMDKSQRQDLVKSLVIRRVGLRRAIGPLPLEWHVTTLSFIANAVGVSLIKTLNLVASSFPKLEMLALNLNGHAGMYDIGDLVSAFARFSSLGVIEFNNVFRRLKLGSELDMLMLPVLDQTDAPEAYAKSVLLSFASCLAKQVRTLDSIHIDDCKPYTHRNFTPPWRIAGWLHDSILCVNHRQHLLPAYNAVGRMEIAGGIASSHPRTAAQAREYMRSQGTLLLHTQTFRCAVFEAAK